MSPVDASVPRPPALAEDAHKGDAGRVLCIVGSRTMPGAAVLVARAAQRAGAGLVRVACQDGALLGIVPVAAPEAVLVDLAALPDGAEPRFFDARDEHAFVLGCGMGRSEVAERWVHAAIEARCDVPLALDADALNLLAGDVERLRARRAPTVLTPHAGEASRLLGRAIGAADGERADAARELADRSGAVVCLKGRHTLIAQAGEVHVNTTGNCGMATAGSGDVLSGILGAFLALCGTPAGRAGRWTALDAARAAVHVHGLAGDLSAERRGRRATIASDLIDALSEALCRIDAG